MDAGVRRMPIAISELPADRSVNYFVDEGDDSSSGRSSRIRCLVQHEPAGSHSTARTSLVPGLRAMATWWEVVA